MEDNKEKQEEIKEENEKEENTEINADMIKLKEDLDNTTDRLKRLMAEFDNFKKEMQRKEIFYTILF